MGKIHNLIINQMRDQPIFSVAGGHNKEDISAAQLVVQRKRYNSINNGCMTYHENIP